MTFIVPLFDHAKAFHVELVFVNQVMIQLLYGGRFATHKLRVVIENRDLVEQLLYEANYECNHHALACTGRHLNH